MIRTGLLRGIKVSTGMRVLSSIMAVALLVAGCQIPPVPPAPEEEAASLPTPEKTDNASEVESLQDQPEKTVEVNQAPPVAEKADDVQAKPGTQVAVEKPETVVLPEKAPDLPKPIAAASDLTDKEVNEPKANDTVSPTSAAAKALEVSAEPSPDAKIYVVDKVYDFGEITPLDRPSGTFQIRNTGTETLYLTRIKVCCGARHELSSDELLPGETSVLSVTYVATATGQFEKYLNVYSNDANNPDVKVTIKGKVVRRLEWTPERFKLFLDQENAGCLPIKVKSLDGKPFALTSFSATENCLIAEVDPNKTATEFVIVPKVDLDKLRSLKIPKGIVRIKHTHPGCDTIAVNYDLFKRYAFTPKRFLVLNADHRKTRIQRLNIMDNYADSMQRQADKASGLSMFTIESVTCEKGAAVLKLTKQIKDGYQLTFEITPPDPAGQRLFQDMISIKISTGDEIQLPVNGIYSMPALSASEDQK